MQGLDLNQRPSGYEPDAILLYGGRKHRNSGGTSGGTGAQVPLNAAKRGSSFEFPSHQPELGNAAVLKHHNRPRPRQSACAGYCDCSWRQSPVCDNLLFGDDATPTSAEFDMFGTVNGWTAKMPWN